MTATPERETTPQDQGATKVKETREELAREIKSKQNEAEKGKEARTVLDKFLALEGEAEEAASNLRRTRFGSSSRERQAQAQKIANEVGRVFELVQLVNNHDIAKGGVGRIQESSFQILKLLDKKTAGLINQETAPFVYPLVAKLVRGTLSGDAIIREYNEINGQLKDFNPHLVTKIQEAIIEAAEDSRFDLPAEGIKRKLNSQSEERTTRGRGIPEEATIDDKDRFDDLRNTIRGKLEADFMGTKSLGSKEAARLKAFLFGDMTIDEGELIDSLRTIGIPIPRDAVAEFKRLYEKIFAHKGEKRRSPFLTDDNLLGLLDRAQREFDISSILEDFRQFLQPDGSLVLPTEEARRFKSQFKKKITKYYSLALEKVHNNHAQFFDKSFGHQEQYFVEELKGLISNVALTLRDSFFTHDDPQNRWAAFFSNMSSRYQSTILTNAETLHNLPLYARDTSSFEKWSQFLGYLFPSEFAEVFYDDNSLMENARREITLYLRKRVVQNNNKIPSDLFSGNYDTEGVIYSLKDYDQIEANLKKRMESLGYHPQDWEYKRARTYAIGLGLANLDDPTLLGTADPNIDSNFKGLFPVVTNVSAKANFGLGRGYKGAGEIPDLLAMEVTLFPKRRSILGKLFHRKSWVPQRFHDRVLSNLDRYEDVIYDQLLDRDGKYQELLSMITIGAGLTSRGGWRTEPLRNELIALAKTLSEPLDAGPGMINASKTWTSEEWSKYFDLAMGEYGTASLWWLITATRSDSEMKRLLATRIGMDRALRYYDDKYKLGLKEKENEPDLMFTMEVTENGVKKQIRVNLLEARYMRQNALRGETFYRYLHRNPGDFFMMLTQMAPDLLDKDGYVFMKDEEIRGLANPRLIAEEATRLTPEQAQRVLIERRKTKTDIEKILGRKAMIKKRWGSSFEKLQEVRKWMMSYIGNREGQYKDINAFIDALVDNSTTAFDVLLRDQQGVKSGNKRIFVEEGDFNEGTIKQAIFGANGLMSLLKAEDFGDFNRVGDTGFFYKMGEVWTLKEADINPFTSDVSYSQLYLNLGKVGEDVNKRWLSDAATVKKLIDQVGSLDKTLLAVANSGDMSKLLELHQLMYDTLKNIISKEYAQRANYILASIVAKFFAEDSRARLPFVKFPFDLPFKLWFDKKIALSKIITGNRYAMTMDTNALRTYFRSLSYYSDRPMLQQFGAWSSDQLENAFEAGTAPFTLGEVVPQYIYFILMFLVWTSIKKALEEAEGKKK